MDNRTNRWLAGLSLFALFGVIALAGRRAQTPQNVLVTNTSSQPVQIAARPGTGAYIVSVANAPNVRVVSSPTAPVSTKDVYNSDATTSDISDTLIIGAGANSNVTGPITLSSTSSAIIDTVNVYASGLAGEVVDNIEINVDSSTMTTANCSYIVPALPDVNDQSILSANTRIYVPANEHITLYAYRNGARSGPCNVAYTLTYHLVN